MARQLQLRRGDATENNSFTGAPGEITFDTTNNRLRVHNGNQTGGFQIPRYNEVVTLGGADNITGKKTFVGTEQIHIKSNKPLFEPTRSSVYLKYEDNSNRTTGWLENAINQEIASDAEGVVTTRLWAKTYKNNSSEDAVNATLDVVAKPDGTVYVNLPEVAITDDSNHAATTKFVNDKISAVTIPAGLIAPYGGSSAPTGWLMCNGQAVSRTTYATLYSKIGVNYGSGNGSTTFNLPDYTNRVAQGLGYGYVDAGLPNITAGLNGIATNGASASGAATVSGGVDLSYTGGGSAAYWLDKNTYTINASTQNTIYGNSYTVQPASVKTYWIIKY